MRRVYPVLFREDKSDKVPFFVSVPDLDAVTQGTDMANAIEMARDVICLKLESYEEKGKVPPEPGTVKIETERGDIISYVDFDYEAYKRKARNRSVKKNCTIPQWLAEEADAAGVNFSRVLQDALIDVVGAQA